jgi:hypothetical protein
MFVPGEKPTGYGSRLAVTDVEGDGTDDFIVGNYHSKLTASHPVNSGFVSRGTFVNLDECAPLTLVNSSQAPSAVK